MRHLKLEPFGSLPEAGKITRVQTQRSTVLEIERGVKVQSAFHDRVLVYNVTRVSF